MRHLSVEVGIRGVVLNVVKSPYGKSPIKWKPRDFNRSKHLLHIHPFSDIWLFQGTDEERQGIGFVSRIDKASDGGSPVLLVVDAGEHFVSSFIWKVFLSKLAVPGHVGCVWEGEDFFGSILSLHLHLACNHFHEQSNRRGKHLSYSVRC